MYSVLTLTLLLLWSLGLTYVIIKKGYLKEEK